MSSSRLIRWSGLALLVAGLLLAIPVLLHPNDADPRAPLQAVWVPIHTLFICGAVLMLFGLIGLYVSQKERAGALGFAGFILSFIGNTLIVFVLGLEAFVIPALAADPLGQALLAPAGPLFGGPLGLALLIMAASFALGTILLGIATFRADVLPRWAGLLLLVGGPLLAFWPPLPQPVGVVGGALVGASFIWSGYAIWAGSGAGAIVDRKLQIAD
jgi:hypothetical protein